MLESLSAIREPRTRAAKARRVLVEADPERAARAMFLAIVKVRQSGNVEAAMALDAITVALTTKRGLPYAARSAMYGAATRQGLGVVARLFFEASSAATSAPPPSEEPELERPAKPGGKPLPLGHRTYLARQSRDDSLRALARDPHPAVIASVLQNSSITERDVLAIASRRPTEPNSQLAVFSCDRWRVRHAVRRALALNPHTPVALAARIMTTLRDADLRDIARDPGLSSTLARHARELEELKRR